MAPPTLNYDANGNAFGGPPLDAISVQRYPSPQYQNVAMSNAAPRTSHQFQQRFATPYHTYPQDDAAALYYQQNLPQNAAHPGYVVQGAMNQPYARPLGPPASYLSAIEYPHAHLATAYHEVPPFYSSHQFDSNSNYQATTRARHGFVESPLPYTDFTPGAGSHPTASHSGDQASFEPLGYTRSSQSFPSGHPQQLYEPQAQNVCHQHQYPHSYDAQHGQLHDISGQGYSHSHASTASNYTIHQRRQLRPAPQQGGNARDVNIVAGGYNAQQDASQHVMLPSHSSRDYAVHSDARATRSTTGLAKATHPAPFHPSDAMPLKPANTISHPSNLPETLVGTTERAALNTGDVSEKATIPKSREPAKTNIAAAARPQRSKKAVKLPQKKRAPPGAFRCETCRKRHRRCDHMPPSSTGGSPNQTGTESITVAAAQKSGDAMTAQHSSKTAKIQVTNVDSAAEVVDEASSPEDEGSQPGVHEHAGHSASEMGAKPTQAERTASFLTDLHARLQVKYPADLAKFLTTAQAFKANAISEEDFYSNTYKLLYRSDAQDLLPKFAACLPTLWDVKQLAWLNGKLDQEHSETSRNAARDKNEAKDKNEATLPVPTGLPRAKKRRPRNGFRTSDAFEPIPLDNSDVNSPADGSDKIQFQLAMPTGAPGSSTYAELNQTVQGNELPVSPPKPPPQCSESNRTSRRSKVQQQGKRVQRISSRPKMQAGHLHSSQVTHVGRVYKKRRDILCRASRPYVHKACGWKFRHPADVRGHHRECSANVEGRAWNEHPSCKVDNVDINYTKVSDGFVVLDQASWDKVNAAIAAGTAEPDIFPPRRSNNNALESDDDNSFPDDDSDEGDDEDADFEMDDEYLQYITAGAIPAIAPRTEQSSVEEHGPAPRKVNMRKRAASATAGRPPKRIIVKAGADEITDKGTTSVSAESAHDPAPKKNTAKKAAASAGADTNDNDIATASVSRAAALGLRERRRK